MKSFFRELKLHKELHFNVSIGTHYPEQMAMHKIKKP